MFAVDCEMCRTAVGLELARISIVDEDMQVKYEKVRIYQSMFLFIQFSYYSGLQNVFDEVSTTSDDEWVFRFVI